MGSLRPCALTRKPLAERFWPKVRKTDACWEWTVGLTKSGYGQIGAGGHSGPRLYAHRVSWELHNGPIAAGLCVCHRCDNRKCVRPDHLFLGTQRDNLHDMRAKGRENHHRVPEATREEILRRRANGEIFTSIALACGVHVNTARRVSKHVRRAA